MHKLNFSYFKILHFLYYWFLQFSFCCFSVLW